jgi:hypothetical protein
MEVDLKKRVLSRTSVRILLGLAPCTLLALPLSCGDDTTTNPVTDGSADGKTDSGGGRDSGPGTDATTEADATQGPEGGDAARMDATTDGDGATAADGDASGDALSDGDGGPQCPPPTDSSKARACLAFSPEVMNLLNGGDAGTDPRLDGMGRLLIQVFDTSTPSIPSDAGDGGLAAPLATILYPPPLADGGMLPEVGVYSLPVIPIDGLPATVYIRTLFIDNPEWFLNRTSLTYGMFVGGVDLSSGVRPLPAPPPPLLSVSLTVGQGKIVTQPLTALRRFKTQIGLYPGLTPAGNGQGPLNAAVFEQAAPVGAQIFGGAQVPCVNMTSGAYALSGFFYNNATNTKWFGADLDDFNLESANVTIPPGSLVSISVDDAGNQVIPPNQRVVVANDQYSVDMGELPQITLTAVVPGLGSVNPPPTDVVCPVPDGGADTGTDAASDSPGDAPDGG